MYERRQEMVRLYKVKGWKRVRGVPRLQQGVGLNGRFGAIAHKIDSNV